MTRHDDPEVPPRFPLDALVGLGFGGVLLAAAALLTWGPVAAEFEASGWFWPAWGLALLVNLGALRSLRRVLRWATWKPATPLGWGPWLATLLAWRALPFTLGGLAALLAGAWMSVALTLRPWWNWWQAQDWPEARCTIVEGSVYYSPPGPRLGSRGRHFMRLAFVERTAPQDAVSQTHSPWRVGHTEWRLPQPPREMVEGRPVDLDPRFALGSVHRCWVAPDDPRRAYLDRAFWPGALAFGAIGPACVLLGLLVVAARPRGAVAAASPEQPGR